MRNIQARKTREVRDKKSAQQKQHIQNVRSRLSSRTKQKNRDKSLNSIRKDQIQSHENENEIGMLDFIFNFGVLC